MWLPFGFMVTIMLLEQFAEVIPNKWFDAQQFNFTIFPLIV